MKLARSCAAILSGLATGFVLASPGLASPSDHLSAIQDSLGKTVAKATKEADLNEDGIVNVLDAVQARLRTRTMAGPATIESKVHSQAIGGAERVLVQPVSISVLQGNQVSVLFLLRSNSTPLVGYTLDVTAQPLSGTSGSIAPNVALTNYFDDQNLITAAGKTRDPFFSVIQDNGSDGVAITTLTSDLSTVLAVDGVNDVFAEVVFDASSNAHGEFLLTLGGSTAISDDAGNAIPFTFLPGKIRALDFTEVPAATTWGICVLALLLSIAGTLIWHRMGRTTFCTS